MRAYFIFRNALVSQSFFKLIFTHWLKCVPSSDLSLLVSLFIDFNDDPRNAGLNGPLVAESSANEFVPLAERLLLDFFSKTQMSLGPFNISYFETKAPEAFLVVQVYFTRLFNSFSDPQQASFEISAHLPDISALALQLDKHIAESISTQAVFIVGQLMKIIALLPLNTDEVGRRRLVSVIRMHRFLSQC